MILYRAYVLPEVIYVELHRQQMTETLITYLKISLQFDNFTLLLIYFKIPNDKKGFIFYFQKGSEDTLLLSN